MTGPDLHREPSAGRINAAVALAVTVLVVGLLAVFLIGFALSIW
jgi:hypothetical protein